MDARSRVAILDNTGDSSMATSTLCPCCRSLWASFDDSGAVSSRNMVAVADLLLAACTLDPEGKSCTAGVVLLPAGGSVAPPLLDGIT